MKRIMLFRWWRRTAISWCVRPDMPTLKTLAVIATALGYDLALIPREEPNP